MWPTLVRSLAVLAVVLALVVPHRQGPSRPTEPPRTRHLLPDGSPKYTNRLAGEPSPYLRQHAHNPVDWYPWGEEAFAAARAQNKPVFLSIGYATCHWCHVMEEESFEDEEIAAYLNANYIAIKVDREQRPDVDGVYMTAVQTMGVGGGWPLNVWLTPDGKPFYGGTYFPPRAGDRGRKAGFLDFLQTLATSYRDDPARIETITADIVGRVESALGSRPAGDALPGPMALKLGSVQTLATFEPEHGGFGAAPKFPRTVAIELLLRWHRRTGDPDALQAVVRTLEAMERGGIHDQVGGGFHRYATDEAWHVPHFEKMLPDQALLAVAYLEGYQAAGRSDFAATARRTLDFMIREMTDPDGGFWSAFDADSEGHEGRFYTWTPDEMTAVLDPDTVAFVATYLGQADLEGRGVLHLKQPVPADARARFDAALAALYEARAKRVRPLVDHKVVTAWNGLAISAMARGGRVLDEPTFTAAAVRAADFALGTLADGDRLYRSALDGEASGPAFLDDYAFLVAGLIDLFETTGDPRWLARAIALQGTLDRRFADPAGGWFRTANDHETLLVREKPDYDGAEPAGSSVAVQNALRLNELTTDDAWRVVADRALMAAAPILTSTPGAMPRMLCALDFRLDTPKEIVVVRPKGDPATALMEPLRTTFLPNAVFAVLTPEAEPAVARLVPLVAEKPLKDGKPTAYVCEKQVCRLPTTDPTALATDVKRVTPLP
jgi:uncharacterized protein